MKKLAFIISVLILAACASTKPVATAAPEPKAPPWVGDRPNDGFKFIGIGFADKSKGGNYQMEAKKNALYDLSSEIKVDISSNSVLYTVQNNNNFNENFNSLIKLSNSDNIEGYTLVDSYENSRQYWVYYQLDKAEYARIKEQKKQLTIAKAVNLINASYNDEKSHDFSSSLKKRIQAFGVLTPYLGEEITFDAAKTNGMKNIFDLTNVIQQQLQSITVVVTPTIPSVRPYQPSYAPIAYTLNIRNSGPLQNFPMLLSSDDDHVTVSEHSLSDPDGILQLKVLSVEPVDQNVFFSLNPDINSLMGTDSIGKAGLTILSQFIQTNSLKVQASVSNIKVYVSVSENNLGKTTGNNGISSFIRQRFSGQEMRITDRPDDADFVITATADTKEDLSSNVLEKNYNIQLATLSVNLELKNRKTGESLYSTQVNDVYGYANSLETAGMNAYSNPKLAAKLSEAIFFLKRKIVVY